MTYSYMTRELSAGEHTEVQANNIRSIRAENTLHNTPSLPRKARQQ